MPADIYTVDFRGRNFNQLTTVNNDILSKVRFGEVENVTYKGADGADVQMFIVYPPGFDPSRKYPLVLMIHGGPHSVFGDQWHYRWNSHLFAQPGYVVALPNFHGSTSFGQEFAESIHGSHADKPFRDIMKATDYMIERGFIDETRMAATGGSYGGYMVSWIAGHTDRFACLVNHAGVYNIHMQFSTDYTWYRPHQYSGSPWENFDRLQSANPAMFAHNFSTPMLVIHGEKDYRVPVGHGLLVYGIYKRMGIDARLVYYPDENHWILSPLNSIFWYKEVHNWLERYLFP
jgi:dipeptidyl aminopeptidase/acylaminoacyl peptidase